jgi:hypothetical protein
MLCKMSTLLLSMVVLLLMGSVAAPTASAEPGSQAGPFWEMREGPKGTEEVLGESEPEVVQGAGGEQTLTGTIVGESLEIASKSVQVKGLIYNNELQGQTKLEVVYNQPELKKPALKEKCSVTLGSHNIVQLNGHMVWKWNGAKGQLEEEPSLAGQYPELVFTPSEIALFSEALPKGTLVTVSFGSGCGVLVGTKANFEGSEVGVLTPQASEKEWSKSLAFHTVAGKMKQHFWNGAENIGVEPGLELSKGEASMLGTVKLTQAKREQVPIVNNNSFMVAQINVTVLAKTGRNGLTFKAGNEMFSCSNAELESGMIAATPFASFSVTPRFVMCEAGISVEPNGCKFLLVASGRVDIEPSPCGPMFLKRPGTGCEVRIANQNGLTAAGYPNEQGGLMGVTMDLTRIGYAAFGCPLSGSQTNGELLAGFTAEAKNGMGAAVALQRR